jgi:putative nucleotidyltransferase with HDIG domain
MCTARDTALDRAKSGEFGADDYVTKPFNHADLAGRIRAHLRLKKMEEQLVSTARELQNSRKALHEQSQLLEQSRADTVNALLAAVAAKDPYTSEHAQKVAELSETIAGKMGLDKHSMTNLRYASLLHDIGKIGVPTYVLGKEERLEKEELEVIRRHPEISAQIIKPVSFLQRIMPIVRHHHENVDGAGYPDGLKGGEIPLESRILAVADAYDAMTSNRPYRDAITQDRALTLIAERAGTQFDPEVVTIFTEIIRAASAPAANRALAPETLASSLS